jgi:hypothetical protein
MTSPGDSQYVVWGTSPLWRTQSQPIRSDASSVADAVTMLALVGTMPYDVNTACKKALGVYKSRTEMVNNKPSYVKTDDKNMCMWMSAHGRWVIGPKRNLGDTNCFVTSGHLAASGPEHVKEWRAFKGKPPAPWISVPYIFCEPTAVASDDDVAITGVRTREERDADGRKHAFDLNLFEVKRPRTASSALTSRVADARGACKDAVDAKVRALMQAAYDDYIVDKIDAAELERRKTAARAQATTAHPPLATLENAYTTYTAAVVARVKAEDDVTTALAAEDAAEAAVVKATAVLLPAAAGPSGVVKGEEEDEVR